MNGGDIAMRLNRYFSFSMSGSGLLWCWGFLHFFWSQSPLAGGNGAMMADIPYLGSTLLVSVLIAVLAIQSRELRILSALAFLGCGLLLTGTLMDVALRVSGMGTAELFSITNIALGGGMGAFWVAWGCLYVRCEIESVEYAFLGWFPLLVIVIAMAAGMRMLGDVGAVLYNVLLLAIPVVSLVCFRTCMGSIGGDNEALPDEADALVVSRDNESMLKGAIAPLVNLSCVFIATSLAWNALLYRLELDFNQQIGLFALGVTALFFIIWFALRLTRRFSLSTLYRWALPLMAVGVVLYQFSSASFIVAVFLCVAIVNIGFEVMGKLFCVYIARRWPRYSVTIIATGFVSATIGGLVGTTLWGSVLEVFGLGGMGNTLLVALVMFVIAASLALGVDDGAKAVRTYSIQDGVSLPEISSGAVEAQRPDEGETRHAEKCRAMAEEYNLSARELEVLALLVQGRSRALIRETLTISKGTVDSHINHIYSKVGVSSKDELIRLYLE